MDSFAQKVGAKTLPFCGNEAKETLVLANCGLEEDKALENRVSLTFQTDKALRPLLGGRGS